ncbi:hypothetical protein BDR26DRAFT_314511 [Obelidium mucronatum]|nr:hypothetical protein BDR26DRAFT_314511 [Obelidium mucronatum]
MKLAVIQDANIVFRLFAADKHGRKHKGNIRLKHAPDLGSALGNDFAIALDPLPAMTVVKAFEKLSITAAAQNTDIVVLCVKGIVSSLSGDLLKYSFALCLLKLDIQTPAFSTFQSMIWAALVPGMQTVKTTVSGLRLSFQKGVLCCVFCLSGVECRFEIHLKP